MNNTPLSFTWIIGVSLLVIVVGLPLAMNLVPRNQLCGLRTRKTLSDERIWYLANSYCGKGMILNGIITIVVALVLSPMALSPAAYASICMIVLLGGIAVTCVASMIYLYRVL